MKIINFLYIRIVCCRNLQLTEWLLLRVTRRLWGNYMLGAQVLLEFWECLLSWLTSWTFHEILISVLSSEGMMHLCLLYVPWSTTIFYNQPITKTSSTSTTVVSTWCTSVAATVTILARLRCFVMGALTRQSSFSHSEGNDEDITSC